MRYRRFARRFLSHFPYSLFFLFRSPFISFPVCFFDRSRREEDQECYTMYQRLTRANVEPALG